ncbi:MAG TPA: fibronectin type III domain-containing protein, partial [Candidatus Saccharimonadales bacterium]
MTHMTTKFSSIKLKKVVSASLTLAVIFSVVPFSNLQTAQAAEIPLVISDVNTTVTDDTATVFWHTNRNASGKIQWGRESGEYLWTIIVPDQRGSQAVTLTGLQPKTKYYFKITAYTAIAEVEAFERSFETLEFGNNTAPVISEVRVAYLTGTTATIQWKTNEPTSAEVEYGLTEQFGSRVGSGGNRLSH